MPRYFLDIREGSELLSDETGEWFASLERAEAEAGCIAAAIARDIIISAPRAEVTIEVRNECGERVAEARAAVHRKTVTPTRTTLPELSSAPLAPGKPNASGSD